MSISSKRALILNRFFTLSICRSNCSDLVIENTITSARQLSSPGLSTGEIGDEVVDVGEAAATIRGGYDGGLEGPKAGLGLGSPGGISYTPRAMDRYRQQGVTKPAFLASDFVLEREGEYKSNGVSECRLQDILISSPKFRISQISVCH